MIEIVRLPAFTDNYLWLIRRGSQAWAVDPGDAAVVASYLSQHDLDLAGILLTHRHADHTGGVADLVEAFPRARVLGSTIGLCGISTPVVDGQVIDIFDRRFEVMHLPGHLDDHVAYYSADPTPLLFCGDVLFMAGCGRNFEGPPGAFYKSLVRIAALPTRTMIYCAHEYTQSNLRFAQHLMPNNQAVNERLQRVNEARAHGEATVPGALEIELHTNPFLRLDDAEIMQSLSLTHSMSPATRFHAVRRAKDNF